VARRQLNPHLDIRLGELDARARPGRIPRTDARILPLLPEVAQGGNEDKSELVRAMGWEGRALWGRRRFRKRT